MESEKGLKTAIFYSPIFLEHDTGSDHPDTPNRLRVIINELNRSKLLETGNCRLIEPKPARLEDLELVHEVDYISLVEKVCASGGGVLDLGDTVVSLRSCEAARLAVGALLDAANMVANGEAKNAFGLVRPPGHHAGAYYALGFCLFNNVAIAASHLIRRLSFERVLILDIDAHHGNGTQEIFYGTKKVLYLSIHEDPRAFPGTGYADEIGEGEGVGYTVNVPLPFRSDDEILRRAFREIVVPISSQYKPQFMLVSAGFDGHYTDPVGALSISGKGYDEIFSEIVLLSGQLCSGRLVSALEGGYSLNFLGKMVTLALAKMSNIPYVMKDNTPRSSPTTIKKAGQVINYVKRIQSSFWHL